MRNQPRYSIFKNAKYAIDGVVAAFKMETSFKLELFFGIFLIVAIVWLPFTFYGKMVLMVTLVLIPIVELLNSAIENVVDLATKEIHPLAKNAKDMGAAAVLFSLLLHLGCWITIIYEELL
jgi:diacylglycerol kinase (ATP)